MKQKYLYLKIIDKKSFFYKYIKNCNVWKFYIFREKNILF